jgi:glycosyltransferase involved in cell wall biosynthesis
MPPTVSVVIPTYNRTELLPRAIESVLTQTYTDLECIVVDGASTEDTQAVIDEYDTLNIMKIKAHLPEEIPVLGILRANISHF